MNELPRQIVWTELLRFYNATLLQWIDFSILICVK